MTTTIVSVMPLYGVGFLPHILYQALGRREKKFSFISRLVFLLSTDRLLPTCCPDPAEGGLLYISYLSRVCEFPNGQSFRAHVVALCKVSTGRIVYICANHSCEGYLPRFQYFYAWHTFMDFLPRRACTTNLTGSLGKHLGLLFPRIIPRGHPRGYRLEHRTD
ncbi:hypothetical protein F4814DRAFT_243111 [Daldinia grandis]|nr:hypothetical protein F4814DRAFT_243111 [Daldinia grandis]